MAERTEISWTDATFNPWVGCTKVGPGCDHCYAEALMDTRHHRAHWGAGQPRMRTSAENWKHPVAWNRRPFYECRDCAARFAAPNRGEGFVTCPSCGKHGGKFVSDSEDAGRVKQVRRRVFCASLADVFDNEVPVEWLVDLLDLIRRTPNLDWLLLSKRIGNWRKRLDDAKQYVGGTPFFAGDSRGEARATFFIIKEWLNGEPPPNVWLGATVVNQEEADRDIPKLLAVPAAVRFLSIEPMLGPVDLSEYLQQCCGCPEPGGGWSGEFQPPDAPQCCRDYLTPIDWVICGGESGHHARPMVLGWVKEIVRQCKAAGVAVHVKQLGAKPTNREGEPHPISDSKGGIMADFPEMLRVREFPHVS